MGRIDLHVGRTTEDPGASGDGDPLRLHFKVTDTGMGIPPEEYDHIFEQFTQVDGSSTRRIGGVGLGLTVARAHAALMGGSLVLISSEAEQGSVFALTLGFTVAPTPGQPKAQAAPASHDQFDLVSDQPSETPYSNRGRRRTDKARVDHEIREARVLVVEDNKLNQRVAASFLGRIGCKVTIADNGKEGLDAATDGEFDMVLMDCQMPVMDGLEATRSIRALPSPARDVPIVALTAHALPEEKAAAYAVGMDDFMTKPVNFERLRRAVIRWRDGRALKTV
jgi:CheY-like chemotaxis protein